MKTILVVEDNPNQGWLYEEELKEEGYHVLRAGDGREGLKIAQEVHPDCVILDINMPGMDGMEMLSRLLEEQPQTRIIINTAYSSYQDHFMSWAADAYVCKSSDLTELKTRVREVLQRKLISPQTKDNISLMPNSISPVQLHYSSNLSDLKRR
jgi:DNA-binding response OmpR family regulator